MSVEFEFPKETAKKFFNKVDSDVATNLLESASNLGTGLGLFLKERAKTAKILSEKLFEKEILFNFKVKNTDDIRKIAIGIDSSRRRPIRVLNKYFCPITTSIVFFIGEDKTWTEYDPLSPFTFFEGADKPEERIMSEIEEIMFNLEVDAFTRAFSIFIQKNIEPSNTVLFCDGPLADPPNKILSEGYVSKRSKILKAYIEKGILILGCIKQIEGSHFIRFLEDVREDLGKTARGFGTDAQLAPCVFTMASKKSEEIVSSVPIELKEPSNIIKKYSKSKLEKLYRFYFTPYNNSFVLCVEYVSNNYEEALNMQKEIITSTNYWTLPGMFIPLPVIASHRKCNIGQGAAEHLYRELLTRSFSVEEAANLMRPMLRGE